MKSQIRLLYLTYNENILDSGILYTQVRQMLFFLRQKEVVEYIRLLSFISPRLWFKRRIGFRNLRVELHEKGIDFRYALMPAAQTWSWISVPLMIMFCLPVLLIHIFQSRCSLIHTRSYGAGLLGFLGAKLTRVKSVFDTRGIFADEMVSNGKWREKSLTYRIWKYIEKTVCRRADAIIGVTPILCKLFTELGARKVCYVPSRAGAQFFDSGNSSTCSRAHTKLIFTGEMSTRMYHPRRVAKYFLGLKNVVPEFKLSLVTHANRDFILDELVKAGVNEKDVNVQSSTPEQVPDLISDGCVGLILSYDKNSSMEVWPVKFPEYLALGLPVILNRTGFPSVINKVERYKLGIIVDEDDPKTFSGILDIINNHEEYSKRCSRYARLKLHISHSSQQYYRLYRQLLSR